MTKNTMKLAITTILMTSPMWATGCILFPADEEEPPASSLLRSSPERPGDRCPYGGVRVESGLDLDGDGMLGDDEVERSSFACNARVDGFDSRSRIEQGAPAEVCPEGGVTILVGQDRDDDGRLGDDEVDQRSYLCHGERGDDGFTSLVEVAEIDPGPDSACYFGGTRLNAGLDLDRDQTLDPEEVTHARDVCAVHTNDRMTLVSQTVEPAGDNCPNGGVGFESGFDEDGDKLLDPEEVQHVGYVCSEVVVFDGKNSLIETSPASGAQCRAGGYVMRSGLDLDADGALSAAEVQDTSLVCNGEDGAHALIDMTPYNGSVCGAEGGATVNSGRDANGDGVLSQSEVEHSAIVCDGADGVLGANALVRTSDDRGVCPTGGFKFESGLDLNDNATLDVGEVISVEYVCDGVDGYDSLIEMGDHGGVCARDGYSVDVGPDLNRDGWLDGNEIVHTAYVCDGFDGFDSLVEVTVDPFTCPTTGLRFDTGLDLNFDGVLSVSEIENTTIVCD